MTSHLEQETSSRQCQEVLSEAPAYQQRPYGLLYRQVQKLAQRHTDVARQQQQARRMFEGIDPDGEGAREAGLAGEGAVGPLQPGAHIAWRFGGGRWIVHREGEEDRLQEQAAVAQVKVSSEEALARYEAVLHGKHGHMSRGERRKMHLYDTRHALLHRAEAAGLLSPAEPNEPVSSTLSLG